MFCRIYFKTEAELEDAHYMSELDALGTLGKGGIQYTQGKGANQ